MVSVYSNVIVSVAYSNIIISVYSIISNITNALHAYFERFPPPKKNPLKLPDLTPPRVLKLKSSVFFILLSMPPSTKNSSKILNFDIKLIFTHDF